MSPIARLGPSVQSLTDTLTSAVTLPTHEYHAKETQNKLPLLHHNRRRHRIQPQSVLRTPLPPLWPPRPTAQLLQHLRWQQYSLRQAPPPPLYQAPPSISRRTQSPKVTADQLPPLIRLWPPLLSTRRRQVHRRFTVVYPTPPPPPHCRRKPNRSVTLLLLQRELGPARPRGSEATTTKLPPFPQATGAAAPSVEGLSHHRREQKPCRQGSQG